MIHDNNSLTIQLVWLGKDIDRIILKYLLCHWHFIGDKRKKEILLTPLQPVHLLTILLTFLCNFETDISALRFYFQFIQDRYPKEYVDFWELTIYLNNNIFWCFSSLLTYLVSYLFLADKLSSWNHLGHHQSITKATIN